MHRHTRSDAGDISTPLSSKAPSFSSERPSLAGSVTFQMPSTVRPAPAYIAASVASQIVTDHHNSQLSEERDADTEPPAYLANAIFSEQALRLLNSFLDHLLFSFLSTARSPSLTAIRPAISDVLKPRLAREAMAAADEELQGLLAGEDDEEFPENGMDAAGAWDVEKVWKRTRLRIMVYTRLGELEDEDEERYVRQERGLSMDNGDDESGLVSWASAIFLTSVIEFLAEQILMVSGTAAFSRMAVKMKRNPRPVSDEEDAEPERIIVEEFDVEKVALNAALGRLWRTWRKRVRAPITPLSPGRVHSARSYSSLNSSHRRRASGDTMNSTFDGDTPAVPELPEHMITETDIAANIPLPMSENDVAEIEVPGLAQQFDEEEGSGAQTPVSKPQRPTSFIMLQHPDPARIQARRARPVSMPHPPAGPIVFPLDRDGETPQVEDFVTPMERMSADHSYIEESTQEGIDHPADISAATEAPRTPITAVPPRNPAKENNPMDEHDDAAQLSPQSVRSAFDEEPQVLQTKRMSIEKSGPPEVIRTYSVRSSNRSSPLPPSTVEQEEKSYLHENSDEEAEPIGIARTTNVPVASPHVDLQTNGRSRGQRKPSLNRGVSDSESSRYPAATQSSARTQADKSPQRKEPVRATSTSSRSPALASLQETERWAEPAQQVQPHASERKISDAYRAAPHHSGSVRSREASVPTSERADQRSSAERSVHSHQGTDGGFNDRTALKRVSSSSSGAKSVSTSILHMGRASDTSLGRPRGLSNRMSEEDREREFDSRVKDDRTVKVTLTPQSVRALEEFPVPRKQEESRPTTSVTVYPPVTAHKENSFGSKHLPRSGSRGGDSPKRALSGRKPLAREPRVQAESIRDFADFIRSTGPPPGQTQPVQPFVPLSSTRSKSPPPSSHSPISSLGRKLSQKRASPRHSSVSGSGEGPSARPKIHMEPRSPAGQRGGNEDLIDFIRQGPPGPKNGQHRIPRTVAPFRSTVDSDQFDRMLDENGNIDSIYGSQVSQATSTNSRTGLIPAPKTVQPAYSNSPQDLHGNFSNSEPVITRTRRRVKDPYAIDTDDEDEDLLTALPKQQPGRPARDESMMDFLNSMDPPTNNEPQPFNIDPATAAAAVARAKQAQKNKPYAQHAPSSALGGAGPSYTPLAASGTPRNGNISTSQQPPRNGTMTNGHGHGQGILPRTSTNTMVTSDAPRAHKPRLQAREAGTKHGRTPTNDLADFLRTSGPPPEVVRMPLRGDEGKSGSAGGSGSGKSEKRRFWRRGRTEG